MVVFLFMVNFPRKLAFILMSLTSTNHFQFTGPNNLRGKLENTLFFQQKEGPC